VKGNITRRGKKSWRLKFDIGRDPATGARDIRYCTIQGTRQDAERKLRELLASIDNSAYVAPSKLTVAEHVRARVTQWEAAGELSPKTAERYRQLIEGQIVPYIGAKVMQKLRSADVESWHTALRASGRCDGKGGLSATTIKHAHGLLRKSLDDAVRHDMAVRNVAAVQSPPKLEREEIVILTGDQVRTVLEGLRGRPLYPIVAVALGTGMRRGELLALRWGNVDLDAKVVRVRQALEQTKGGLRFKEPKTTAGRRDITLPDAAADALRDHRRQQLETRLALGLGKLPDDALVFGTAEGEPRSPNAMTLEWKHAAAALGVDVTFHALRHSHASQLISARIPITMVSKRLGHASPKVTLAIYAHMFEETDKDAADAINKAMANLGR
jgi:integrase